MARRWALVENTRILDAMTARWTAWVLAALLALGAGLARTFAQPAVGAASPPARSVPAIVGWWNIKRLGHGHKDLARVGHVASGFDVLGVGEVMKPEGLGALVLALPGGAAAWGSVLSPEAVGTRGYREYYAVVFRRAVASCDPATAAFYPDLGDRFAREPFGVDCRVGRFDFTLVTLHVVFGRGVAERAAEVRRLGEVYRWFQARDPGEQDVIIAGDFNLVPTRPAWLEALGADGLRRLIDPAALTTLSGGRLRNHYDDVVVDPRYTTEFTGDSGVRDLGAEAGSLTLAERTMSDHLPVFAQFATDTDDD